MIVLVYKYTFWCKYSPAKRFLCLITTINGLRARRLPGLQAPDCKSMIRGAFQVEKMRFLGLVRQCQHWFFATKHTLSVKIPAISRLPSRLPPPNMPYIVPSITENSRFHALCMLFQQNCNLSSVLFQPIITEYQQNITTYQQKTRL